MSAYAIETLIHFKKKMYLFTENNVAAIVKWLNNYVSFFG